jgi:hypothetical protein
LKIAFKVEYKLIKLTNKHTSHDTSHTHSVHKVDLNTCTLKIGDTMVNNVDYNVSIINN